MRNNSTLRVWLAVLVCAGLTGTEAIAIDNGACCVQSTSRLESLINPNKGSDESFFTAAGGPPNVMFLLDTSCSMNSWPEDWPTTQGCNHPTFAGSGYDPTTDYRSFISGMTGPAGAKVPTYDTQWFNNERVFRADGASWNSGSGYWIWNPALADSSSSMQPVGGSARHPFGHDFSSAGGPTATSWSGSGATAAIRLDAAMTNSCSAVTAPANVAACRTCLQTQGYFVQNATTRIATGNYLEYYSPRDVSAMMTLSHLLFDVREVRLGIMTFDDWGSSACYQAYGSPSWWPGCLWQTMSPNCNQLYPLNTSAVESSRSSILNALSKNHPFSTNTPLASMLYLIGYHLRSGPPPANDGYDPLFAGPFPNKASLDEPTTVNQHSICTGCTFNAAIILTDGAPNSEIALPPEITSLTPACTGSLCASPLDNVAAFLWNNDIRVDFAGKQRVATYTIGFATGTNENQLLTATAKAGGGKFYPANGSAAIKQAILEILDDVNSRNNSFASAAVASVQTGSSSTPALLPRMLPKAGQPWEGKLWRFEQYNEFVETTGAAIADLNADGDNEDVFIVDSATPTASNIVTEAADGTFVRNSTTVPATPFWEANEKLVADLSANVDDRKVWTIIDTTGDGAFTDADMLTRFRPSSTAANDIKMAEYMGLVGSPFCPSSTQLGSLLTKFGMSLAAAQTAVGYTLPLTPVEADYARLCARVVMRWVSGSDLYDADGDNNRAEVRENVLGDIFHASPVVVGPPVGTFLCDLGLSNQCARTLYSQALGVPSTPTPSELTTLAGPAMTTCVNAKKPSYEAYVWDQRRRDQLVLVGANDGMVHAFLSGRAMAASETCIGGFPTVPFDKGTGQEMWAFIPPDLLPKLPDMILNHQYMVDGDIMVRDIWADTAAPYGSKSKAEFHTLAVVAEGRGGKHYFALEVKYLPSGQAEDRPGFRWMFPQPCSEESATFGKTLLALSPKAPPIGPVLIDNSTLPTPIPGAVSRYGVDTHERWVVALAGGWSPALEKGRGIYMVDAWNGKINGRRDNLWWKFEFDDGAGGSNDEPRKNLSTSVSAPVALVDYGADDAPRQDGFFDTAVFGDTGGQIWVARLHTPGQFNSTTYRLDNWYGGRAFEMDRDGVGGSSGGSATLLSDGGYEPLDPDSKSVLNKAPFFYLPSVAIEHEYETMRVFAGTGNRYAILEEGAGTCRFDNPLACSKSRCKDVKVVSEYKDAIVDLGKMETHWKSRRFEHGKLDKNISIGPATVLTSFAMCGIAGTKQVEAANEEYKVGECTMTSGSDPTPGDINEIEYECGLNASGSSFTCTEQSGTQRKLGNLLDPARVDTAGLGNNRFIGIWAYGGKQSDAGYRGFSGASGVTPQQYDEARLSDRSSANPSGELTNVTSVGCTGLGCDGGASEGSYGWFYDYQGLATKTATGGAVISSCVLWSDLTPTGGDGGVCGASVTPLSAIYQADFITGQPNCAYGFLPLDGGAYSRSQTRTVVAPPPEAASVVQISKAGEIRYSAMIVEPGQGQAKTVNVSGSQDVLQLVYELPVSRSLHNCRHADAGCSTIP